MTIKIIKTKEEYQEALEFFNTLMDKSNVLNPVEEEQLELLANLIQDYEERTFPDELPDPIEAIRFRMEQEGLTQDDLIPFIGSRSKVSEILAGKRPLSINMIRSLHDGLGISAKVLLNQSTKTNPEELDYSSFPVKEMLERDYIQSTSKDKDSIIKKVKEFISVLSTFGEVKALMSRTIYIRSKKTMSNSALLAWIAQVIRKAEEKKKRTFELNKLNDEFMTNLVKFSNLDDAISKAIQYIEDIGILVVVEPHMKRTYLDGAAIMIANKNPIIGLTIRHDRLDNFWFTLLHELSHIRLHFGKGTNLFIDDVETNDDSVFENEADNLASEIMIPDSKWKRSPVSILPTEDTVKLLADNLNIHPSIVAGKARYVNKSYHILNDMVGRGKVRSDFLNIKWKLPNE